MRATAIELEPLQPEESARARRRAHRATLELPVDTATVLAKTEGNPLFVEETVRMLAERPRGGAERIPDTLQALIAARIDRLPPTQRTLLQRAAAMGRLFMRGALEQLSPELDDVDAALEELVLRDLVVREARATISGEQAFKFKHVLIREVAYSGPLEELARRPASRVRVVARRARRRRAARDPRLPPRPGGAAARGARRRRSGGPRARRRRTRSRRPGRRALSREAFRSARKLLLRAVELAPTLERRYFAAARRGGSPT